MKNLPIFVITAILFCVSTAIAFGTEKNGLACYPPAFLELKNGAGCFVLSKIFDAAPGPRIVLAVTGPHKYLLNPQSAEYPKSQDLSDLSWSSALEIFGTPRNSAGEVKTFDLMLATGTQVYRQSHLFQLEATFRNGKLFTYHLVKAGI